MHQPSVSVALATFNGARFLDKQLNSLVGQSLLPIELVVCDDLSEDNTVQLVEDFARTAPFPVRVYKNSTRLHYSENFLQAARLCEGDYIAFCDQDDIWLPDKLKVSVEFLIKYSADLCVHGRMLIDHADDLIDQQLPPIENGVRTGASLDPWDAPAGHACTIKRDLLEKIPDHMRPIDLILPERRSAHDRWIYFLACTFGTIVQVAEPLIQYRQHESNVYGHRAMGMFAKFSKVRNRYSAYLKTRKTISESNFSLVEKYRSAFKNQEEAEGAIGLWDSIAREYARRLEIFSTKYRVIRVRRILECLRGGVYVSRPAKKARLAFLEDAVATMIAKSPV